MAAGILYASIRRIVAYPLREVEAREGVRLDPGGAAEFVLGQLRRTPDFLRLPLMCVAIGLGTLLCIAPVADLRLLTWLHRAPLRPVQDVFKFFDSLAVLWAYSRAAS